MAEHWYDILPAAWYTPDGMKVLIIYTSLVLLIGIAIYVNTDYDDKIDILLAPEK